MTKAKESIIAEALLLFIKQVLRSFSQIMLQNNLLTGFLFLAGILIGFIPMGIGALFATAIGTLTAAALRYPKEEINQGLYGFSAALVGVALLVFFESTPITFLFIAIGSAFASVLQHFFIRKKLPIFTLPFVLVTWLAVYLIKTFFPELQLLPKISDPSSILDFTYALKGFGQVIFQEHILSGIFFFIAVAIASPVAALFGLAGAILAALLAMLFGIPLDNINAGLSSYNAVLCAIVFAELKFKNGLWVFLSVFLAALVSLWMTSYALLQLTFPFVAASFITVILKGFFDKKNKKSLSMEK